MFVDMPIIFDSINRKDRRCEEYNRVIAMGILSNLFQ
jgi:hypothetical protein